MTFRPETFDSYQGQDRAKGMLRTVVENSISTGEVIPHIMFLGNAGCGKTTLAKIIAKSSEQTFLEILGADINEDFFNKLITETRAVLFIDEIHTIPKAFIERMYRFLEDRVIVLALKVDGQTNIVSVPAPHITVIGATTDIGLLPKPFRDRFNLTVTLEEYTEDIIRKIVAENVMCKTKTIMEDAQEEIIKRSRCVPRLAVSSIIGLRSMYPGQQVTREKTLSYFNAIGLDGEGLNELNRKTLKVMKEKFPVTPVGLHTLASVLGENPDTLMAEEGFLLKKGLILLTPQGRTLTNAGRDYQ